MSHLTTLDLDLPLLPESTIDVILPILSAFALRRLYSSFSTDTISGSLLPRVVPTFHPTINPRQDCGSESTTSPVNSASPTVLPATLSRCRHVIISVRCLGTSTSSSVHVVVYNRRSSATRARGYHVSGACTVTRACHMAAAVRHPKTCTSCRSDMVHTRSACATRSRTCHDDGVASSSDASVVGWGSAPVTRCKRPRRARTMDTRVFHTSQLSSWSGLMDAMRASSNGRAMGWTCGLSGWIGAVLLGTTDRSVCGGESVMPGPATAAVGKSLAVSSVVSMLDM
ncbi:hypothetical protein EV363DRAFT_1328312, partial [Boletus edulis]